MRYLLYFRTRFLVVITVASLSIGGQLLLGEEASMTPLPNPYTPDFSGKAIVHCICILATSGCQSSFFWHAAGAPTHDWSQENFFTKGTPVDLAEACYRKRDVPGLGAELCCPVDTGDDGKPDAKMLHGFFGSDKVSR